MGDGKTRQVELVIMDDANEPPRTVTNARRMVEQTTYSRSSAASARRRTRRSRPTTAQNKIPNMFIYSGIYEWGDEKQNPWGTAWCRRSRPRSAIYAKYLEEHKPEAKVAILHINTDFGTTSSTASRPP